MSVMVVSAEFWKGAANFNADSLGLFAGRKALLLLWLIVFKPGNARTLTTVMRSQPTTTSQRKRTANFPSATNTARIVTTFR
jgi:hypothetical protein